MSNKTVLLAMSGGVDSSVAAFLLHQQGFNVIGVTFRLWDYPDEDVKEACCSAEDCDTARMVCSSLTIPHYSLARGHVFNNMVVQPFINDYTSGKTPSPCVQCNNNVKFPELRKLAAVVEADYMATGHYAMIRDGELFEAVDKSKDQSYYLYNLPRPINNLLLPIGHLTKTQVREIAKINNIPGWNKQDSMGLCFTAGNHAEFIEKNAADKIRPGLIIGPDGKPVGAHNGIHKFTVGQTKNIGVSLGRKTYVAKTNPETGDVFLSHENDFLKRRITIKNHNFNSNIEGSTFDASFRFRGNRSKVQVISFGDEIVIESNVDVLATSGQYVVLYSGERIVGGGEIN